MLVLRLGWEAWVRAERRRGGWVKVWFIRDSVWWSRGGFVLSLRLGFNVSRLSKWRRDALWGKWSSPVFRKPS